jgi:hypothetical protein
VAARVGSIHRGAGVCGILGREDELVDLPLVERKGRKAGERRAYSSNACWSNSKIGSAR